MDSASGVGSAAGRVFRSDLAQLPQKRYLLGFGAAHVPQISSVSPESDVFGEGDDLEAG